MFTILTSFTLSALRWHRSVILMKFKHCIQTLGSCNLEDHDALLKWLACWDFWVHQWESQPWLWGVMDMKFGWCYWGYVLFDDDLLCPIINFLIFLIFWSQSIFLEEEGATPNWNLLGDCLSLMTCGWFDLRSQWMTWCEQLPRCLVSVSYRIGSQFSYT